jgi:hypothetical protein
VLPRLDELIRIEGGNDLTGAGDDPVRGIHIEGLTLSHCDRAVWQEDDAGIQHDWSIWDKGNALIRFRGAEDCSVKHCTLEHTGGDGVRLDLYAQRIQVCQNHLHHTGGIGVLLAGYGPGHKDVNHHNQVIDNDIHHTGTLFNHSMGVFVWQSGDNRIAHNHIRDLGYMGIVLSGVRRRFWNPEIRPRDIRELIPLIDFEATAHLEGGEGDWDAYKGYMHCRNNVVEYNEVHDCMRMLGDGNTIYLSATGPGNIVRANLAYNHDHNAIMRTDDDQFDSIWEKNVLIGNPVSSQGFAHKGCNAFDNNLLINCTAGVYTGVHGPSEGIDSISRNVFVFQGTIAGDLLQDESGFAGGKVDHNLYWAENAEDLQAFLEKRHKMNSDPASRIADPGFADAENLDFSFLEDSPALDMGIQPIDLERIGRLQDPAFARLRIDGSLKCGVSAESGKVKVG